MVAARDIKCGNDVAKMAALGRYAEEFIVYAVSYQENGQLWHRVSSDQEELWRFVEDCQQRDIYPTIVEEWVNRTLVPSGERDTYLLNSKISLAQKMKRHYTEAFMAELTQFAQAENNNTASALLEGEHEALLGCFERERLERFGTLVQYAYNAKKLSRNEYDRLQNWLAHIFKQMEDDVVIKKNFGRTFYGIGYKEQSKQKYYTNANKPLVWQKRQQLLQEGKMTTPIWQKTYWYDYQPDLLSTKKAFLAYLEQWFDGGYWQQLEAIQALPAAIDAHAYEGWLRTLEKAPDGQLLTARYYKTCWGL